MFTYQSPDELLGTGNQITISDVLACDYFTLHISVRSSDGVVFTASKIIFTGLCSDCTEEERTTNATGRLMSGNLNTKVYPNPITGEFSVEIYLNEETSVGVTIVSLDGKWEQSLGKHQLSNGKNTIQLRVDNLPEGLYLLRATSIRLSSTTRVSLIKGRL